MKCIFVTSGQEELGCCTLQAVYFIPREVKNSSLGPSALGMNFFFPWDEIHPSGCKTQFFISAGYEIPQFFIPAGYEIPHFIHLYYTTDIDEISNAFGDNIKNFHEIVSI